MPVAVWLGVTTGATAAMVKTRVALPVPPELVALMVVLNVPAAEGVPLMTPVAVLMPRPAGKPVAL